MSRSVFHKRRIIQDSDDEFEVEINKKTKTLIETEEQNQSTEQNENENEEEEKQEDVVVDKEERKSEPTKQPETVSAVLTEEAEAYGISFEAIEGTDRYQWTKYLNIRVIEDVQTGFINATKMCAMYSVTRNGEPKQFKHWKRQTCTAALVHGIMTDDQLFHTVTGGQIDVIRGTYVHRDLAPSIAMWCSAEFGLKLSRVINVFISMKNKTNQLSTAQINELQEQCNIVAPNEIITPQPQPVKQAKETKEVVVRKTNTATVRETEMNVLMNFKQEYVLVTRRYTNQINNLIRKCQDKNGKDLVEIHRVETCTQAKKLITRFKNHVQKSDAAHLFIFKHTGFTTDIEAEKVIGIFNEVINPTVHDNSNDNEQKEEEENITEN